MPRNGAGTYTLPEAPFVFDTVISETAVNSDLSDIASALTGSVAADGQTPRTANSQMNNYKHTEVLATSGSGSRTEYASSATAQDNVIQDAGVTAGSSTVYTATLSPAITAYVDKACYRVQFDEACGNNPTINFNSVGAKKIYKNVAGTATQLAAGDVQAGPAILRYDSTLDTAAGGFWLLNEQYPNQANSYTKIQKWAKGADVASANALTLGNDGNYFDITGTTAITSIGTKGVGTVVKLHFDAALTLTNNATDLILPGGANITTAAGDEAEFVEYASGDWRCTVYTKASGRAVVGPVAQSIAILEDQKPDGTNGGTPTASAWTKHTLNTEVYDADGIVSISSDVMTLATAGTYKFEIMVMGAAPSGLRCKIRDTTNNADYALSDSQYATASTVNSRTEGVGVVTITGSTTFELQYFAGAATANIGLGSNDNMTAGVEIYARVVITKLS